MAFNNEIEKTKKEIEVLTKKLSFLEEIEKQPRMNLQQEGEYAVVSYHDKVYYRLMGETTFSWYIRKGVSVLYPVPTLVMVSDAETERLLEGIYYNHIQVKKEKVEKEPEENEWKSVALKLGENLSDSGPDGYYEFSADEWFEWVIDECLNNEVKRLQKKEWNVVRESVKWCEENPDKDPLDCVKPQTPEQVADGLKEAFREAVKQGVVSSVTKPQNLTDLLFDWWEDVFTTNSNDDMETSIADLVDRIDKHFIPPSHDTNGYQWEKCLKMMRENLR